MVEHMAGPIWDVTKDVTGAVKEGGTISLELLEKLAARGMRWGVGIPLVMGALLGVAASKITSPSKEDLSALEKRMVNARIKTMIAEHRRKQQAADRRPAGM